jgi:hypothetical protein
MKKEPTPKKPQTEREWALYRARLSCKIARDGIEGKCKSMGGADRIEWTLYNLAHAIEEIARAMESGVAKEKGQ